MTRPPCATLHVQLIYCLCMCVCVCVCTQELLTQVYHEVEVRLHADEFTDFAHYDRERRRVRSAFLEKAPKQAAALAVMYEFMEDEVCAHTGVHVWCP